MRTLLAVSVLLCSCATALPPSPEHPRSACYLSCSDGRPPRSVIQRQCVAGKLRGKDISVTGEVVDEQNPHMSAWLADEGKERGKYLKDQTVAGTCTMFFISRGAIDEHMLGVLNSPRADRP
jgi:hypothetical protein